MNHPQFTCEPPHNSHKEQQEKISVGFLLQIINGISDPVFVKDRLHCWVLLNDAFCNFIGHSREDLLGKSDYDFFPKQEADVFWEKDELVFTTGITNENEEDLTDAFGVTRVISTHKSLFEDETGNKFLVGTIRDTTGRKQAESALIRSNAVLKAQQEAAIDGILIVDENRRVVSYNQRFAQLWQISEAVLHTGDQRQFIASVLDKLENPDEFLTKVEYLYYHIQETSRDEVALKDGRTLDRYSAPVLRCVRAASPLGEAACRQTSPVGDHYGRVWYFRDITESKRAEESLRKSEGRLRQQAKELEQTLDQLQLTQIQLVQSEKMSSLGQLVAGVAHEINNPVNFISGNLCYTDDYTQDLLRLLQLYQQHYPDPVLEIQDYLEVIELDFLKSDLPQILTSMKLGADRIQQIVVSLRTFSRLDEAEIKTVDIHEGIDSTLMILQSRLNANDVDKKRLVSRHRPAIEVIKEYSNLPLVECYAGQLNQVFINILNNAIDALEESFVIHDLSLVEDKGQKTTPTIRIYTEVVEQNRVTIRIADNGPGIQEEVKQRLFDPFFTTKPVGKGTGLGLSISYQIVRERHGGSLQCISKPGQGAEFVITIPLVQACESQF